MDLGSSGIVLCIPHRKKTGLPVSHWSDKNQALQPQKMARCLKIVDLDRGIVLCIENKGADQLHGYHAADLCLFSHMQKADFLPL